MNKFWTMGAALTLGVAAQCASAGTYASITIDGGFTDWAGVPILVSDPASDGSPIDLATVQLANDVNNLYIRLTFHTAVNPNAGPSTFLAVDNDNNTATGFDIYGLGQIGSEAGWQNDFPFDQRGGYNSGSLTGGAALISPYFSSTTEQEYSIPRSATFTNDNAAVFGSSFTLLVWTDAGSADVAGPVFYEFAPVPEPTAMALIGLAVAIFGRRRR